MGDWMTNVVNSFRAGLNRQRQPARGKTAGLRRVAARPHADRDVYLLVAPIPASA
jgi:hypothetical protein